MGFNATVPTVSAGAVYPAATYNTYVAGGLNGIQAAWTTWTPTVSAGLTVGNGAWTGSFLQVGKTITARFSFTLGSTSSVTGGVILLFPIAVHAGYVANQNCGSGNATDVSVGSAGKFTTNPYVTSTATSGVGSFSFAGSTSGSQLTTTAPFTWAVSDVLSGTLSYEAA